MSKARTSGSRNDRPTRAPQARRRDRGRETRRSGADRSSAFVRRLNGEQVAEAIVTRLNGDHELSFIDHEKAKSIWQLVLNLITKSLLSDRPVVLRNIGTLAPYTKKPQRYKHPSTGELRTAKSKRHIRFILSPNIRKRLRRGAP